MAIWSLLNGWKTILGYLLLQIPEITSYPGIGDAIKEVISNPTRQNIINFVVQLLLAIGVIHKVEKEVKKFTSKK